jgi:hypothetical protein
LQGIQPLFVPFCFTILSYVARGSYGCFGGSVGLQIRALCGKEGLQAFTIVIQLFVGVEVKKRKSENGETKWVVRRASRRAMIRMY